MALRCLLFTSDMGTAAPICHVLADLAVETEHCIEAAGAVQNLASHTFQILVVDWDNQPEASDLIKTSRERKPADRPLTLAIVSDDASVPKALQAGANSILRKPILINQVKDTLTTARDLLRARQSAPPAAAAAAAASASASATVVGNDGATLRAGDFLQSSAASPAQYDTESEMKKSLEQSAAQEIDALKDLEPMAAAVVQEPQAPPPAPPRPANEPRGLQWYLNQRAATLPKPPIPAPPPVAPDKTELLGFDQIPPISAAPARSQGQTVDFGSPSASPQASDQKAEELFAYIADGEAQKAEPGPRPRLGKGAIGAAVVLAACAVVAAPQAPWHQQMKTAWGHGRQAMHAWFNPPPVTNTAPAPAAHEDFGRAGDEYKLPVAEAIPDATTDPTQIRVTPMVDPTIKKPNSLGGNAEPNAVPVDGSASAPADPMQAPPADQVQGNPAQGNPAQGTTSPANASSSSQPPAIVPPATQPSNVQVTAAPAAKPLPALPSSISQPGLVHPDSVATASTPPPTPVKNPRPVSTAGSSAIPSSLKSQMASMTPEASGNKAPETALPSIEPVSIPEATERTLLTDHTTLAYPANVKAPAGTVVLQILVGRDGTVQEAKFLQGSLAFARTAIDGVKQWKFKPYIMNGRAVSVQTNLTITFKPGQ